MKTKTSYRKDFGSDFNWSTGPVMVNVRWDTLVIWENNKKLVVTLLIGPMSLPVFKQHQATTKKFFEQWSSNTFFGKVLFVSYIIFSSDGFLDYSLSIVVRRNWPHIRIVPTFVALYEEVTVIIYAFSYFFFLVLYIYTCSCTVHTFNKLSNEHFHIIIFIILCEYVLVVALLTLQSFNVYNFFM